MGRLLEVDMDDRDYDAMEQAEAWEMARDEWEEELKAMEQRALAAEAALLSATKELDAARATNRDLVRAKSEAYAMGQQAAEAKLATIEGMTCTPRDVYAANMERMRAAEADLKTALARVAELEGMQSALAGQIDDNDKLSAQYSRLVSLLGEAKTSLERCVDTLVYGKFVSDVEDLVERIRTALSGVNTEYAAALVAQGAAAERAAIVADLRKLEAEWRAKAPYGQGQQDVLEGYADTCDLLADRYAACDHLQAPNRSETVSPDGGSDE